MAHAQKPDFDFRRNGRVHLNRRGCQFGRLLAAEVCASAVVMLDTTCSEVMWRVLATHSIRQFPFNSRPMRHRVPSGFNWTVPSSCCTQSGMTWNQKIAETLDRCAKFKMNKCIWSSYFLLHAKICGAFLHFSFFSFLTLFPWKLFVSSIQGNYALEKPRIVENPTTCGNSERVHI